MHLPGISNWKAFHCPRMVFFSWTNFSLWWLVWKLGKQSQIILHRRIDLFSFQMLLFEILNSLIMSLNSCVLNWFALRVYGILLVASHRNWVAVLERNEELEPIYKVCFLEQGCWKPHCFWWLPVLLGFFGCWRKCPPTCNTCKVGAIGRYI